ncbi:MAG: right-handed parallel beta-helix repeat-containing protein [Cyanobacteria bacterium J06623_4]
MLAISAEAIATPISPEVAEKEQTAQITTDSTALRLRPFFNLNHTEGGGQEGFTSVGGFLPLFQSPGQNVTFIDGRVTVDNDGNFGGGLQAGYRALLNDSTIWGAYAGVDVRTADGGAISGSDRTFTQATVGTELLGENWDLTLNANLPLGNARQVLSAETQVVNPRFVENQLLLDEQQVEQAQAALTTVSLDGGLELFDFGEGSSLWGRGGVYFLGGEASEDSLGFRTSLDYRLNNNLRFGVGVQNDGVFGTNAIFSVNALLGSSSRPVYDAEEDSAERPAGEYVRSQLWARAAEPIARTNTVLIENQTNIELLQEGIAAINPETDQAFVFRHVDPSVGANGVVNGVLEEVLVRDATFEDPVRTIAEAANIADANADNIIFVQAGDAGGGFTLPDGVQVRSVGPVQLLDTQFGEVILPGSGSGNLPTVDGTVTIGNNSLVSGLEIDLGVLENGEENPLPEELPGAEILIARRIVNGIVARGENIAIEDNVITNVDRSINLTDTDGTVTIVRNQISNTIDGVVFDDINETDDVTITVADNVLDTTNDAGIAFGLIEGDATADIAVTGNQFTNVEGDNIFFDDIQGNAVVEIAVADNVISGGKNGIEFSHIEDTANATIDISNNQIDNVIFEGIDLRDIENDAVSTISIVNNQVTSGQTSIDLGNIENRADATITIVGNTLNSEKRGGIFINDLENNTVSDISISENTILGAGEEAIEIDRIENNANATISILNNQISNAVEEGIIFDDIENTTTANITVSDNTITDVGGDGIRFDVIENNANVTLTIDDNTITNPGGDGVSIEHTANTDMCLALDNNTVTNPGADGFNLLSDGKGQFQIVDLANVTDRNIGSFSPADIETNEAFSEGTPGVAPCP